MAESNTTAVLNTLVHFPGQTVYVDRNITTTHFLHLAVQLAMLTGITSMQTNRCYQQMDVP